MKNIPSDYSYASSELTFASNWDGKLDLAVAKALTLAKVTAAYYAWDWYGTVWFEDNKYHCLVMQYCKHVNTISADTPDELQKIVCDAYGYD